MRLKIYSWIFIFVSSALSSQNCDDTTDLANRGPTGVTMAQFSALTNRNDKMVLVYFMADWCVVCKRQKPILHEIKQENKQVCELLTLDMECNPLIAEHFEVDALPLILLYKKGQMTFSQKGFMSKSNLQTVLKLYE